MLLFCPLMMKAIFTFLLALAFFLTKGSDFSEKISSFNINHTFSSDISINKHPLHCHPKAATNRLYADNTNGEDTALWQTTDDDENENHWLNKCCTALHFIYLPLFYSLAIYTNNPIKHFLFSNYIQSPHLAVYLQQKNIRI